jgi:hypothetical protein
MYEKTPSTALTLREQIKNLLRHKCQKNSYSINMSNYTFK